MSETLATGNEPVILSESDGVLHIRLNRPDKKNAITRVMYAAMAEAMERANDDPAIQAVLFSGAGDSFTAGNDLNDFLSQPPGMEDSPVWRFLTQLRTARKVLIAAVHGSAVGIGTTMLLHCDLVYVARSAKLALPFVKLGLVPEAGSSLLLPRLAGHPRAAELLLLGEPFDAAAAYEIGLANRVVEDEVLLDTARAAAAKIAALPSNAVQHSKALLKKNTPELAERMEEEVRLFAEQLSSPEFREAATAFLEKRPPNFAALRKG